MPVADQPTRISLFAPNGRMGKAIAQAIADRPDFKVVEGDGDVLVDFSSPSAIEQSLARAVSAGIPILIGTTGLAQSDHAKIDQAAQTVAVLQTGNTSLGVNLLAFLVREAAARLDASWDIELVEMHHRMKVDAPSGTALLLGEAAAEGRGIDLNASSERGRDGITGARSEGAIGFASLRGGTVAGEHSVIFAGDGERILLSHKAEDRMIFALGALKAAQWLKTQPAGRYDMAQVLGL